MGSEQGRGFVFLPLTMPLSYRWQMQMQVQPETQVRWVLGMRKKRLSLVQSGQAWVLCPGVSWAYPGQVILRRLWSLLVRLALHRHTVRKQPRNCLGNLRRL